MTPCRVTIVGMGDMAHALCHLFHNHNLSEEHYRLTITKPGLSHDEQNYFQSIPLVAKLEQALAEADLVILAVPATAYPSFVESYGTYFKQGVILVDVSNEGISGFGLDNNTSHNCVKAFADNGAVNLLLRKPWSKQPLVTSICGGNADSVQVVQQFAQRALGFDMAKVLPFNHRPQQHGLPPDWVDAMRVLAVIFLVTETYAVLRYNVFKGFEWFHLPLQVTNKAFCWTALTAFTLTSLPGLLARMSKQRKQPIDHCVLWGLSVRKPLGILALGFLGLHVTISMLLFSPAYYEKFFVEPLANHSKLNATGETSFFCAILATGCYSVLGIASLPSIASQMTKRSWDLIYGAVAWTALALATLHVYIMGDKWLQPKAWPGGMPPITLLACIPPICLMILKLAHVATRTAPADAARVVERATPVDAVKSDESNLESGENKPLVPFNNLLVVSGGSAGGKHE